jgi:hypothetical protein
VFVPQKVFSDASCEKDHRDQGKQNSKSKNGGQISPRFLFIILVSNVFYLTLAAVLVWIYGGGYVSGTKSYYGSAAGLVTQSLDNDDEGVIFVQLNYRLGLFVRILSP